MSPFTRTGSGLENEHLFHRVDYVVFTEGEHGGVDSIDGLFWARVFASWLPTKRVRIKLMGGKPVVRKIARQIVQRNLQQTIAALDRDYDDWDGKALVSDRVVYTWGYSVENDLLSGNSLCAILAALFRQAEAPAALTTTIRTEMAGLDSLCTRVIALDYAYFRSQYALLDREKPGKTIQPAPRGSAPPTINRAGIRSQIESARAQVAQRWYGPIPPRTCPQRLVGRIWAYFVYHLIVAVVKSHSPGQSVTKDHFLDLALEKWKTFGSDFPQDPISVHYSTALATL